MHDIAVKIGTAVMQFIHRIDTAALLNALKIVGVGMLGIFTVTLVIISVVILLDKLFSK